jgi:hypothetical protein
MIWPVPERYCITTMIVGALLLVAGCSNSSVPPSSDLPEKITYKVIGSARRASLTYRNASGGTEQKIVRLPWILVFDAQPGTVCILSAQKEDRLGTVEARIYVDTDLLQQAESSSPYGIASVSGLVTSIGFSSMTPAQHLEKAKLALQSALPDVAARHLTAIPHSVPQAVEAKAMTEQTLQMVRKQADQDNAGGVQEFLREKGYDVTVDEGEGHFVMNAHFKDAASRARFLVATEETSATLCEMGFREVHLTGNGLPSGGQNYPLRCK